MLKSKSPSACAWKSYKATTYCAGGFGFGFNSGGGGGGRLVDELEFWGVYGGGAACARGGGGGGFFVKVDGERETEDSDEPDEPVFDRRPPPGRVAIILAVNANMSYN